MDTTEFSRLLYDTEIPANLTLQEQIKVNEPLFTYVQKNMPITLYRYRRCNERNIEAFYKDYFWVSAPMKMNDGFDTRLYMNTRKVVERRDQLIKKLKAQWKAFFDKERMPDLLSSYPEFEKVYQQIVSFPDNEIYKLVSYYCDYIQREIDLVAEELLSLPQQGMKIASMSQKMDSPAMWGNYANNETGFVLGYDCRNLGEIASQNSKKIKPVACWPVIYSDSRFQVPDIYVEYMIQHIITKRVLFTYSYEVFYPQIAKRIFNSLICPDILMPAKIALHKANDWEVEEEWRMFCSESTCICKSNEPYSYFIMKPSVIYLGQRISTVNEKILTGFAKEKDIPVYKMHLDDSSPKYTYIAEQI